MAETVFSVLRGLEHATLSPYDSGVFKSLVSFVESGVCSDSTVDKFIMQNFRMTAAKLTEIWNRRFNGSKSADTFRGQMSLLSGYICSIFGCTAQELNDAFVVGDMDILRGISDIIGVFPYGNMDLTDAFIGLELLPVPSLKGSYSMKDCQRELLLLWSLNRDTVQSLIAGADAEKLSYVLGVLSQPLVCDVYEKNEGRKKKLKTAKVNRDKVQLLKALLPQTVHLTPPVPKADGKGTAASNAGDASAPVFCKLRISNEFMALLEHTVQTYRVLPQELKQRMREESTAQTRKDAEKLLKIFTDDLSRKRIDKLNAYDLFAAMKKCRE